MRTRPAAPADAVALATVHVRSWQAAYRGVLSDDVLDGPELPENRVRLWRRLPDEPGPRDLTFVAERPDGRIVGLLHGAPTRDPDGDPDTGEVIAIYAEPTAWGTGVGRELMTAALQALRGAGFASVTLWVLDSNDRARRFYERAGFLPDGAQKDEVFVGAAIREVRHRRRL